MGNVSRLMKFEKDLHELAKKYGIICTGVLSIEYIPKEYRIYSSFDDAGLTTHVGFKQIITTKFTWGYHDNL